MFMVPYFSIIIPAYNEENYVRKTLHSIKQQTYQDYETIVVANGCTDKTEEIVKKRANNKLRLFSLPKPNVSVARNAGALNANGEILLFLDADTILGNNCLKKIKESFTDKHSVATTMVKPDATEAKYRLAMAFKNLYNKTKIYQGCSGTLICRKIDFHNVEGYNPDIIVKEHRKLIIKLNKLGKYNCIDTYVTTSMRRLKQWGLLGSASFWLKQWLKNYISDIKKSNYEKIR